MTRVDRRSLLVGLGGGVVLSLLGRSRRAVAAVAADLADVAIRPDASCALLVIDVQNCFLAGGTLAVKDADSVVPIINRIAPAFANVVLTQDWHTPHHASFASTYAGRKPFETTTLSYGNQVLWPDHCVQGTTDADIGRNVDIPQAGLILRKGFHRGVDSYSAFVEADHKTPTGLAGYLGERGIKRLFLAGLATDFCVAWTALDGRQAGFDVSVIEDACRGIDLNGSLAAAWKKMQAAGVKRIQSTALAAPPSVSINEPSHGS